MQLINELAAVDARLAPQFRRLLADEEAKQKLSSRATDGKKAGICGKNGKVAFVDTLQLHM